MNKLEIRVNLALSLKSQKSERPQREPMAVKNRNVTENYESSSLHASGAPSVPRTDRAFLRWIAIDSRCRTLPGTSVMRRPS